MCGFFGNFSNSSKIEINKFKNIIRNLSHRGPDEESFFFDEMIQLGFRRLSIIDLKHGSQPMISSNKNLIMVFNGEIYNYKEVREILKNKGINIKTNSDSEVLLESYQLWGNKFLDKINGMFAIAIYHKKTKKIKLIRDRFGIKPLYFSITEKNFIFSSEIKSLIESQLVDKKVNFNAISSYLSFRYPYGVGTFFENISSVEPGEILEFCNGKINREKYWDIPFINYTEDKGENYYLEEMEDIFKKVMKDHLVSDVPVGALLSGGLDSSLMVALMSQFSNNRNKTFSASFDVKEYDENVYAQNVANQFKCEHLNINLSSKNYINDFEKIIEHKSLPLSIPHEVALFQLFKKINQNNIKVVISGEGADEQFGGYGRVMGSGFDYKKILFSKKSNFKFLNNFFYKILGLEKFKNCKTRSEHFYQVYSWIDQKQKKNLFSSSVLDLIKNDNASEEHWKNQFQSIEKMDENDKMFYIFQKYHLRCLLERLDNLSMAHSVESRVPFCDYRIINFINKIPYKYKIKWKSIFHKLKGIFTTSENSSEKLDTSKYLLRKFSSKYLPKEIYEKKKLGFPVPLDNWMSKGFDIFIKDVLLDDRTKRRGLFNTHEIEKLITNKEKIKFDFWGKKLWMLANIEIWHRKVIDR